METALWVIAICVAIKTAIVLLNEIILPKEQDEFTHNILEGLLGE